jgi:hypothetical protein
MERKTIIIPEETDAQISQYAESKGVSFSKACVELMTAGLQLPPPQKSFEEYYRDAKIDRTLYLAYSLFIMVTQKDSQYNHEAQNKATVEKLKEFKKFVEGHYAKAD